jgi:hypothetical protein
MENKKLFPRCLLLKGNSVFVGPDGYLKPCCFVNNARDWNEFLLWVNDNNLNVEDLNLFDQGLDNIKASPTWQLLKKQLESNDSNCPSICKRMCSEPTQRNLHPKV